MAQITLGWSKIYAPVSCPTHSGDLIVPLNQGKQHALATPAHSKAFDTGQITTAARAKGDGSATGAGRVGGKPATNKLLNTTKG